MFGRLLKFVNIITPQAPPPQQKKIIMELSGIWTTTPTCLIANKIIIASRRSGWPILMGANTKKWKTYNP